MGKLLDQLMSENVSDFKEVKKQSKELAFELVDKYESARMRWICSEVLGGISPSVFSNVKVGRNNRKFPDSALQALIAYEKKQRESKTVPETETTDINCTTVINNVTVVEQNIPE